MTVILKKGNNEQKMKRTCGQLKSIWQKRRARLSQGEFAPDIESTNPQPNYYQPTSKITITKYTIHVFNRFKLQNKN